MKQKLIESLRSVPLNISSTRRSGSNGLRNADEVADVLLPVILAAMQSPEMVEVVFQVLVDLSQASCKWQATKVLAAVAKKLEE